MTVRYIYYTSIRPLFLGGEQKVSIWDDIGSPEGVKTTIFVIIAGIAITIFGTVGTAIAAGVGTYILQVLNKTGFTIPASANYVAPIESVPILAFLILGTVGVIVIIVALLKRYGGLSV
jgi:energy-converting hydrogenase Eha subunit E